MIDLTALGVDLSDPVWTAGLIFVAVVVGLLALSLRGALGAARDARALREEVTALQRSQAELTGAHVHATQAIDTRMAGLTTELGANLTQGATRTAEALSALQERLDAIDRAQTNIERLSGDVLGLQDILSNKQARGAFGEIQLHDLLSKALPPSAYRWQATLPNGTRADCVIDLPDPPGPIVIDAKFPLEPYEALVNATDERERKDARRLFRTAIRTHIKAISEKYIQPGRTADSAVLFLPSEAVYAELHGRFSELVREGFAARVWIVSPTTCMALLTTLRAVLKDVRMRDEARALRTELQLLNRDIGQMATCAGKLATHFDQARRDVDGLLSVSTRAEDRMHRLETLDFNDTSPPSDAPVGAERGVRIYRR